MMCRLGLSSGTLLDSAAVIPISTIVPRRTQTSDERDAPAHYQATEN
jgi:hypothetical protein